ncbi:MAG: ribonuclease Z [Clostridia bacterium]|nr:ribonuclease Z [Clostridia bacterium]
MKLIVCVDENNGMLFNNRRQSRDRKLIQHIVNLVKNKRLWINSYSENLFKFKTKYILFEDIPNEIEKEEYCFVENISPKLFEEKTNELIIYNWNRIYQADMYFDICLDNWILKSENEFEGFSHEKITQQIYTRGTTNEKESKENIQKK